MSVILLPWVGEV